METNWKEVAAELARTLHKLAFGINTGHTVGEALIQAMKAVDRYRKLVGDDEWPYGHCSYCGERKGQGTVCPSCGAPYQGGG